MSRLLDQGAPITANGTYEIPADPGDTLIVDLDGTFDGATAKLNWRSSAGNDHPVLDAAGEEVGGTAAWVGRVDITKAGVAVIVVTGAGAGTSLVPGWVALAKGPTSTKAGKLVVPA